MISMNIPVGVSDFVEIRRNGYYYIDKTALIAELLKTTGTKVTLITRAVQIKRFVEYVAESQTILT